MLRQCGLNRMRQDIYYGVRDKTRVIADQHANLGRTIDSSIVQHLEKLRTEIKAHIKVCTLFLCRIALVDHTVCTLECPERYRQVSHQRCKRARAIYKA